MSNRTITLLIAGVILALASVFIPSPASATETGATIKDLIATNCEGIRENAVSALELRYLGATVVDAYSVCNIEAEDDFSDLLQEQCELVILAAYSLDHVDARYRQLQSDVLATTFYDTCVEAWVEGLSTE